MIIKRLLRCVCLLTHCHFKQEVDLASGTLKAHCVLCGASYEKHRHI